MARLKKIKLGGGLDRASAHINAYAGSLITGVNVECKPNGGYRRIKGYVPLSTTAVPGNGRILGVWVYGGELYTFRNSTTGTSASMWQFDGSGWQERKSGLDPDGHYEFVNYAFAGTEKMYGVSGSHKAFEWDGSNWTDLSTGMVDDRPSHLIAHRKHLFLSFGQSVQFSGVGEPTSWSLATGAGEMVLGHTVTGFAKLVGGVLAIFTENSISTLSGASAAQWSASDLAEFGSNAGAVASSIQQMGSDIRFMGVRGVTDFVASQRFGDFEDAVLSRNIDPLIEGMAPKVSSSVVVREKNQYRIFFENGEGFIFVFSSKGLVGITQTRFPNVVRTVCNSEDANGEEVIYFGSDDGLIYQMERGDALGGNNLLALFETAYTNLGLLSHVKRFRRARIDMQANGIVNINMRPDFRLGAGGVPATPPESLTVSNHSVNITDPTVPLGGSATLSSTILGGAPIVEGRVELDGRGDWISFRFYSNSETDPVWEIDGITVEFLPGRQRR